MVRDLAPSLALGRDPRLPAWRAPNSEIGKPALHQLIGDLKSPRPPQRNPKPWETPSPDNRGPAQHEEKRLHKRIVNPPSLEGFSRLVCPPLEFIDFPPPRSKYEMSGALELPPSVDRRPRSPAKREWLASNGDIVRNQHRSNRHSGKSNGSNGPAGTQGLIVEVTQNLPVVLEGRRGIRRKDRLNVRV